MPILWRYLLRSYFQVFVLCVVGFIAILLVTRFQEIAKFASSGASWDTIFFFTLYQIPYILPLAIPISCLIAAMILFQKLSHTQELTAFRTCGLGLFPIAYPLILAGVLLSLLNFSIVSELSPYCRGLTKQLVYETTSKNPLTLLQKETILKLDDSFIDVKKLKSGKSAEEVVIITRSASNNRLNLMTAKELMLEGDQIKGKNVTFISNIDTKNEKKGFDHLVIENQKTMQTKASSLTEHLESADWFTGNEYLPMRLLMAKEFIEKKADLLSIGKSAAMEMTRRATLGIAAFTFTFIGIAFGMEIGRQRRKKGILLAFSLAAFFLVCFVSARSFRHTPQISMFIYLLPHPVILLFCYRNFISVARGIE